MAKILNDQIGLINIDNKENEPVVCLGKTFENDDARRAYFTEKLRKKLQELKKIEGFPIGEDEDILALSDPPYYTACPNPFIPEFIEQWEKEKKELYGEAEEEYHREPFAADVSEGKNDPIYNAHSYHTKVPHKAIMRYILHYTKPGDIVFDGFCGTGMTGVAAKMCGNKSQIESLGFSISDGSKISNVDGNIISQVGERNSILSDLSPTATLISYNYNINPKANELKFEAQRITSEVKKECSWMFETSINSNGVERKAIINYVIWSDVFICPHCTSELIFWNTAVDEENKKVKESFLCDKCGALLSKDSLEKKWLTKFDREINETIRQLKQVPVLINCSIGKEKHNKKPDKYDLELLEKIDNMQMNVWVPKVRMPEGDEARRNDRTGFTHIHHFYTKRNLWVMALILSKIQQAKNRRTFLGVLRSSTSYSTKMVKVNISRLLEKGGVFSFGAVTGTLYMPSIVAERPILEAFESKFENVLRTFTNQNKKAITTTQSTSSLKNINDASIDYVFLDPPFGSNLMYSELNCIWESWLKIFTNNNSEAIINKTQEKGINEYLTLMNECFREVFRLLKPTRWMTVEFSNSQSNVWNAIQEAIQRAGFIIANVSALDKQQGSFKAVTTTVAVKQDLVISAYKPSINMSEEIMNNYNDEKSAWIFTRNHLEQLPVFIGVKGSADLIVERSPRVLFDRMVAYHVQNGYSVPISSAEFQAGITQRFPMRDGMVFLENQVAEYDKKRILAKEFVQMSLFVSDENSAIEWLRLQLYKKPQTRQDLHPGYMKEIQHISKYEKLPELDVLLEQNFLQYDGTGPVPSQIHGYLSTNFKDLRELDKEDSSLRAKAKERWYVPDPNKQADLEKLREKSLMREFVAYVEEINRNKKKLKQFRLEAIRAGFKKAWGDKDYNTIVEVGSKIPENVLQEDDKLLMYYDNAQIRLDID